MKTKLGSNSFSKELEKSLEKLKQIPKGNQRDEVSIPVYLHKNFLVRKAFVDRLKIAHSLTSFEDKTLLDYGCGSGIFLQTVSGEIKSGIGVDIDITVAKKICTSKNISLVQIKRENEITRYSDIDIITSFDVMEHVINLEGLLKIVKNVLSPTGSLIISGPTENFLYKIARFVSNIGIEGNLKGEEEHVRNIFDIIDKIKDEGFVIQKDQNLWNLFHMISFKLLN